MNPYRPILLLLPLGWAISAHGQGASRLSNPGSGLDSKRQLQQAAERLREAQKSGELDRAKSTAQELIKNLPPGITDAAKAAVQSPEARAQAIEAAKAAAGGMLPQFQGMAGGQTPGASPPPTAPAVPETPPTAPAGPAPGALQPLEQASTPPTGLTRALIESDRADFDLKQGIFIYRGHVKARHPDFYIECEELEVHMIQEDQDKAKAGSPAKAASKDAPSITKSGKKADKEPPIKKAIARGPMVIVEKRDPGGDVQQGRCKRLEYDRATGNMTLSDFPQVQKGNVLHMATTADTVMTFDKDGRLTTNRPARTVILSDDQPPGGASSSN